MICGSSIVVSIGRCQRLDRGSSPRCRIFKMKLNKNLIYTNVIFLLIFILIAILVKYTGFFNSLNLYINSFFASIGNSFFITFSKIISIIFDTTVMVIISLVLSVYLWKKYSKQEAIFFSFVMLCDAIILFLLKFLFKIPRPISKFVTESDFAFPSGHATTSVVFFGLLTYLIIRKAKNFKLKTILISVFMILLIAISRLYLGIHWLTDILGGFALGIFILTGFIIIKKLKNGRS